MQINYPISDALGESILLDKTGKETKFKDFLSDKIVLVIVLRHFGCIGCSEHVQAWLPRIADFQKFGVDIMFIGNGNVSYIEQFIERHSLLDKNVKVVTDPAIDNVLQEFQQYLTTQRNLSPITIKTYLGSVECFLKHCYTSKSLKLDTLSVPEISDFMLQQARHYTAAHTQLIASGLRNFFRFLLQQGVTKTNFAQCVLAPARRQLSTLPKFMKADDVELLLKSIDQETAAGCRNFAILQLLARLGLRAGEVASLTLDDINWNEGLITVGGKGGHLDQLPLPHEVGQALANYLHNVRPNCSTRHAFVRHRAPLRGFSSGAAVGTIVRRALDKADLHPAIKGAHLLRHSLATSLLRGGASLTEIGELLRHRNLFTTQIYAKVDEIALSRLAPPWPGGEA